MFFKIKKEKGAAAVEFAFLLPILVMIAFGIIYFAPVFNNYIAVNHAARDGARLLAVKAKFDANGNLNSEGQFSTERLEKYIRKKLPEHVSNDLDTDTWGHFENLTIAIDNPEPPIIGSYSSVTISGDFVINIPLIPLENNIRPFSKTIFMRIEQ